ncbi:MAG: CPBP family intramembrane metalloprotease [Methanobrevibacter sp.]|jgi:membrane protease YdiL (CAAX protease family)|nr:CPBP family intramembrane metalloprotease [Candidatus Methanoflexus mossambicus]
MTNKNKSLRFGSIVSIIIAILIYFVGQMITSIIMPLINSSSGIINIFIFCVITIILTLIVAFKVYGFKPSDIGLNSYKFGHYLIFGVILAFLCQLIMLIISIILGTTEIVSVEFNIIPFILAVMLALGAGVSEEILDRGFLASVLKPTKNKWLIILVPTIFFTVVHIINVLISQINITTGIIALITTFLAGLFLILIVIKTGSLTMAIAWHAGWDFFMSFFGINVSSIENGTVFLALKTTGSALLTGGTYGMEASIIAPIVLVILIVLFYKFYPQVKATKENKLWSMD